jgi:NAD(P)-dependent dehydrogenase (short-subunit alcohol dehydrogenase family)
MNRKLDNKVAVITGGSAGIGWGAAQRFAAEGARVFITGRRQSELDKAVATIEGNVTAIQGDASHLADIDRIYQTVKRRQVASTCSSSTPAFTNSENLVRSPRSISTRRSTPMFRGLLFTLQKALGCVATL